MHDLAGVYAASVTPVVRDSFSPDVKAIPILLDHFARRGCHGALLLGTTGEGPSFSSKDRKVIFRAAGEYKDFNPSFRLLAGTGTPSLTETIELTRSAFSSGFEGVVVLPPYYYRKTSETGLFSWFDELIRQAVPEGGYLLGYHIPPVTGIGFSLDLLEKLKNKHPQKFAGIKDSSSEVGFARSLGERFGSDLLVFNGNDKLFTQALDSQAGGCITALANLYSNELRAIWEGFQNKVAFSMVQERLDRFRTILDKYAPYPAILKALLSRQQGFPLWGVLPPLMGVSEEISRQAANEFELAEK